MKRPIIIVMVLASCIALYFMVSTLMEQGEYAKSAPLVQKSKALEDLKTTTAQGQLFPQISQITDQKTIESGPAVTGMTETPLIEDVKMPAESPIEETAPLPVAAGNKPVDIPAIKELNTKAATPQAVNVFPIILGSGSTTPLPPFEGVTNTTGPVATSDESQPLPIPPAPASPQLSSDTGTARSTQPPPNTTGPVPKEGYASQPLPAFTPVTSDNGPVPISDKEN